MNFWRDLGWSAHRVFTRPMLLVGTMVVWLGFYWTMGFGVLWLVAVLLCFGFAGTQRVLFCESLTFRQVIARTTRFIGRFTVLALLVLWPWYLFNIAVIAVAHRTHHSSFGLLTNGWVRAANLTLLLAIDALLTFVVPALALHTRHALVAMRTGARMLRRTWPRCLPYLLLPGITLDVLANVLRLQRGWIYALTAPVVAVIFKGAILAFYLRHADDGLRERTPDSLTDLV